MQNRTLRKMIAAALVLPMCLSLAATPVFAEDAVGEETVQATEAQVEEPGTEALDTSSYDRSGVTGDCKWNYDSGTKTLTISSNTGKLAEMPDYEDCHDTPWGISQCEHIVIDDAITSIGNSAFDVCGDVKDIKLSNNLKRIGKDAFRLCGYSNDIKITLPESLETIETGAFNTWLQMTEITIPKNVKSLSRDAFPTCKKLENINVVEDNPYYCSIDGIVYDKAKTTLVVCPPTKTKIEYPSTLKKLSANVLSGCARISEMDFNGDVPEIAENAFCWDTKYDGTYKNCANAYYSGANKTWTDDKLKNYGGAINWVDADEQSGNDTPKDNAQTANHYDITTDGGTWDGTHYYLSDGTLVENAFFCDGTYTYYLQADGTPMQDRLTYHPDGKHVIYFDAAGHEVFSNFTNVKKSIAGDGVDDMCFFDVYGYMYVDFTTYDQAGVSLYYANPYGVMERNGWFQFSDGNIGYANADGTLLTNQFSYDQWGRMVYFQGDGKLARGVISDGANYYQMDETDGHLVGMFPVE